MSTNFRPVEVDVNCAEVEEDEDDEVKAKAESDDEEEEDEYEEAWDEAVAETTEISAVDGLAEIFWATFAFFLEFSNIFCRRTAFREQRALTIIIRSEAPLKYHFLINLVCLRVNTMIKQNL